MLKNKKGFTLIEMLVVIAIIAVLVSIVIPVVGSTTAKARAAVDASNLRSTLGVLNTYVSNGGDLEQMVIDTDAPDSMYVEDCELHVLYTNPGFIEVYFVKDSAYYGLDYMANVAQNGEPEGDAPGKPATAGVWYKAGEGKISETP